MLIMIAGLVLFLGMHSVRMVAPEWREAQIQRMGEGPWKGIYSVVSIIGLALAIWGYGQMRHDPIFIWSPPIGLYHLVALFMIPAFILLVAAFVPRNHIRARLGHPMVLAVKTWAFSHLLANGRMGDIIFFGAFLVWTVFVYRFLRQRDRAVGVAPEAATASGTAIAVVLGVVAYWVFATYLHVWVAGVPAFTW